MLASTLPEKYLPELGTVVKMCALHHSSFGAD
jgi:hypothetical protein